MKITEALAHLDPDRDEDWTADGQPRVDVVSSLVGAPVHRQQIIDAAPNFTRTFARDSLTPPAEETPGTLHVQAEIPAGSAAALEQQLAEGALDDNGAPADEHTPSPESKGPEVTVDVKARVEVDVDDDAIFRMPLETVLSSAELTDRAWREIERRINRWRQRRDEAQAQIDKLNVQAEFLSRHRDARLKSDPNAFQKNVEAYLERGNQQRAERAARAQAFVASGTTARDVVELLQPGSRIDRAMSRKTGFGTKRPSIPIPPGQAPG